MFTLSLSDFFLLSFSFSLDAKSSDGKTGDDTKKQLEKAIHARLLVEEEMLKSQLVNERLIAQNNEVCASGPLCRGDCLRDAGGNACDLFALFVVFLRLTLSFAFALAGASCPWPWRDAT